MSGPRKYSSSLQWETANTINFYVRYIWPLYWGPTYANSYFICIITSLLSVAMCWAYRLHLAQLNKEAETIERVSGLQKGFRYFL